MDVKTPEEWKKFIDEVNQEVWKIRGAPTEAYDPLKMITEALQKAREINSR